MRRLSLTTVSAAGNGAARKGRNPRRPDAAKPFSEGATALARRFCCIVSIRTKSTLLESWSGTIASDARLERE